MSDGDLRKLLRKHLPAIDWQAIETGGTGRGIPDVNYCFAGAEGWIECKLVRGWQAGLRPEQVGWLLRRARAGGRAFILIRRINQRDDELWLYPGDAAADLKASGIKDIAPLLRCAGGPSKWDWPALQNIICAQQSPRISAGIQKPASIRTG